MADLPAILTVLDDLVAIRTVPGEKNAEWLRYVSARLAAIGAEIAEVPSPAGERTGLIASIGPDRPGGLVLSGHLDVVSADGQSWTSDPFRLRRTENRVYGRGTTDMKGFVACAIAVFEEAARGDLSHPVHIALSADEETACQSARSLAAHIAKNLPPPRGVLVGEPTALRPSNGQKGSYTYAVDVTGRAAHASMPELGVSATAIAARLMTWIEDQSARVYGPETTSHSVGVVEGGTASNIIAGHCRFEWDIRLAAGDRLDQIEQAFHTEVERLLVPHRENAAEVDVRLQQTADFPGFLTAPDHPFVKECLMASDAGDPQAFPAGSEGGIYSAAGLPVVIMGPGDLAQAHIADEFLEIEQLESCAVQLRRLMGMQ
ncbi:MULTISPECIES: acetylornithine deacetylase [unclassified Roseovarius]|uniref:acetylornithine deacetylase n=1 Tax=unclassified Roseovarius TaxID=2614913 RepID=UPI00273F66EC|nr:MULTISPECIES: acetylornithine deacetylase [unclassified Roseovarius]